jgi:hypothetical protein
VEILFIEIIFSLELNFITELLASLDRSKYFQLSQTFLGIVEDPGVAFRLACFLGNST